MACRVGMSKIPEDRIAHWKRVEGHDTGHVIVRGLTYDQAHAREQSEARQRGCVAEPGGPRDATSDWAVYVVSGGTIKP